MTCQKLFLGIVSLLLISESSALAERQVFTRRVDQITGKLNHPVQIKGQDSPITFKWRDKVYILFGDTIFNPNFSDPDKFFRSKFNVTQASDDFENTLRARDLYAIALRFSGSSYYGGTSSIRAKLVIPLINKNTVVRNIRVKLELGEPNAGTFVVTGNERTMREYIASQPRIAVAEINVTVPAQSNEIVVQGPALDQLLDNLFGHSSWDNFGERNSILMFLSRTDSVSWSPNIGEFEKGNAPTLEFCHGNCP